MRLLLLFFVVFGMCGGLLGQPGIQWQRTLGGSNYDSPYSIDQTNDNGYVTLGLSISENGDVVGNHGFVDYWVVKMDSTGTIQWKKCYGGSNNDWPYSIVQTTDGGYIAAGYTESNDGDVSGNHGDKDMWIVKLDENGTIEWQKALGGSGWEDAWSIKQAPDGGYIAAGRTSSTNGDVTGFHGYLDYWVVKLSPNGELEWQKALGGSGLDLGYSISPTNDGGYIVTGEATSQDGDIENNHGSSDYWIVKLNFEGKILWEKSLGGTSLDRGNDIQQTRDGGYIAFGQTSSNNGDVTGLHGGYDYWAVKLSETGDIEWQKALGGSGDEFGQSIRQTIDDGYILAGSTRSSNGDVVGNHGEMDIWVIKLNPEGQIQWQKPLGGSLPETGLSIKQTTDQGFIISGDTWSNNGDVTTPSQGKTDFWIIKLNPETSPTSQPATQPLNLYPNPAQNTLKIQIPAPETHANISIQDPLGRVLHRQNLSLDSFGAAQIELAQVPPGFYFVQATTPDGQVFSGKIQKLE